jgi:hypothetical protein
VRVAEPGEVRRESIVSLPIVVVDTDLRLLRAGELRAVADQLSDPRMKLEKPAVLLESLSATLVACASYIRWLEERAGLRGGGHG